MGRRRIEGRRSQEVPTPVGTEEKKMDGGGWRRSQEVPTPVGTGEKGGDGGGMKKERVCRGATHSLWGWYVGGMLSDDVFACAVDVDAGGELLEVGLGGLTHDEHSLSIVDVGTVSLAAHLVDAAHVGEGE